MGKYQSNSARPVRQPEIDRTLTFTALTAAHGAELKQLIAIYQEAIDPSEQKTPAELEAMIADLRYHFIVCQSDGDVSGFSISFQPAGADFWLLEYMAVSSRSRSKGLGQATFFDAYRRGLARDASAVMLLEVDRPGGSTNPSNDTLARFRFYRRLGCRCVEGLDYILPLETGSTPPPMLLLTYCVPPLATISKARLKTWLSTVYSDVYAQSASDPRLERMTSQLGDTIAVVPL
jgi:hypothetical protein